jgi:hypothetical protein
MLSKASISIMLIAIAGVNSSSTAFADLTCQSLEVHNAMIESVQNEDELKGFIQKTSKIVERGNENLRHLRVDAKRKDTLQLGLHGICSVAALAPVAASVFGGRVAGGVSKLLTVAGCGLSAYTLVDNLVFENNSQNHLKHELVPTTFDQDIITRRSAFLKGFRHAPRLQNGQFVVLSTVLHSLNQIPEIRDNFKTVFESMTIGISETYDFKTSSNNIGTDVEPFADIPLFSGSYSADAPPRGGILPRQKPEKIKRREATPYGYDIVWIEQPVRDSYLRLQSLKARIIAAKVLTRMEDEFQERINKFCPPTKYAFKTQSTTPAPIAIATSKDSAGLFPIVNIAPRAAAH